MKLLTLISSIKIWW